MFVAVLSTSSYYFYGYVVESEDAPFLPYKGKVMAENESWKTECGDCHMAFHPTMLPKRSWQALMDGQEDHFGDDLALDDDVTTEITDFLLTNSAESGLTEAANKINRSIPASAAPIRITESRYWKKKHRDIDDIYWKSEKVKSKSNCSACHLDAEDGWFEDSNMRLPKLK